LEDAVEFADNPEPRCPCVLLLDTSGSMQGAAIQALNEGLRVFRDEVSADPVAARRVEVAIVTFDSEVTVRQDFVNPDAWTPGTLEAEGLTHMGEGIQKALDLVEARKSRYRSNGIAYYRPWVFLITDGAPQGESEAVVEAATRRLHDEEAARRVAFFAVGVEGADMDRLGKIVVRTPLKLKGLSFRELFIWLSASMAQVSQAKPDEQVPLPAVGWAAV
ncbi:MAG TPA: VWA domain-containing protein, partial [Longimicrobium sp.]